MDHRAVVLSSLAPFFTIAAAELSKNKDMWTEVAMPGCGRVETTLRPLSHATRSKILDSEHGHCYFYLLDVH